MISRVGVVVRTGDPPGGHFPYQRGSVRHDDSEGFHFMMGCSGQITIAKGGTGSTQ